MEKAKHLGGYFCHQLFEYEGKIYMTDGYGYAFPKNSLEEAIEEVKEEYEGMYEPNEKEEYFSIEVQEDCIYINEQ